MTEHQILMAVCAVVGLAIGFAIGVAVGERREIHPGDLEIEDLRRQLTKKRIESELKSL